jgi:hypothetical protein
MDRALAIVDRAMHMHRLDLNDISRIYLEEKNRYQLQATVAGGGTCLRLARLAFTGSPGDRRGIGVLSCVDIPIGTIITLYGGEYIDAGIVRQRDANTQTHSRRSGDVGMVWDGYALARDIRTVATVNGIREDDEIMKASADRRSIYMENGKMEEYGLAANHVQALMRCGVGFMINGTRIRSLANVVIRYVKVPMVGRNRMELVETVLKIVASKAIAAHQEILCYYGNEASRVY